MTEKQKITIARTITILSVISRAPLRTCHTGKYSVEFQLFGNVEMRIMYKMSKRVRMYVVKLRHWYKYIVSSWYSCIVLITMMKMCTVIHCLVNLYVFSTWNDVLEAVHVHSVCLQWVNTTKAHKYSRTICPYSWSYHQYIEFIKCKLQSLFIDQLWFFIESIVMK